MLFRAGTSRVKRFSDFLKLRIIGRKKPSFPYSGVVPATVQSPVRMTTHNGLDQSMLSAIALLAIVNAPGIPTNPSLIGITVKYWESEIIAIPTPYKYSEKVNLTEEVQKDISLQNLKDPPRETTVMSIASILDKLQPTPTPKPQKPSENKQQTH